MLDKNAPSTSTLEHYPSRAGIREGAGATHWRWPAAFAALLVLTLVFPARAQQPAQKSDGQAELKKEIEELKAGQQALMKELQEIRKLLLPRQPAAAAEPPREVVFDISGAPFKGDANARLTLIEFSDYQCPFCARHVRDTLPQIERDYVKTGKLKYVFRDMPLESIHPHALKASEAAHCAGEQGKFWEMHNSLFGNQTALSASDLATYARGVGVDAAKFQQCLDGGKYAADIRRKMSEVLSLGVTGTPTFFVGVTTPGDPKVKVVRALRGAASYANFKEVLDGLLSARQ
ncbi:MAG TPA: DsbA family protein [Pyrinomonadaceae bacterium]|nr:DsbA family protein [Pyrinomonadaceae bacterium]